MELKDYTTEELKAELKRRATEERRLRSMGRSHKAEYTYARAVITSISKDNWLRREFRAKILDEDLACMDENIRRRYRDEMRMNILRANFNKDTAPDIGDIVRIRSCKTNYNPSGFGLFSTPYIVEVIKRAEN